MCAFLRKELQPTTWSSLLRTPGKYVLAYGHHFVTAKVEEDGSLLVNFTNRTHAFQSFILGHTKESQAFSRCEDSARLVANPEAFDVVCRVCTREERPAEQEACDDSVEHPLVYPGAGIPEEVLVELPSFFFSLQYLRALACTNVRMRRAAGNPQNWRDRILFLHTDEFQAESVLQAVRGVMALSRNVTLRVRQLAMFQPSNALLVWRAESVQIPQNMVNGMSGFRSVGPLMGGASFNLQLPKSASGLYIVVREWRGAKQTYLRIDNLFRPETMWSFGVNQETARPHPGRHRFQILPDVWNRFDVRWTNNSFQVSLNGVGVSNLRQRHPNDDSRARAAPPLSEVCIWVFGRLRPQERLPLMQALPSCILLNAEVHCCICDRNYTL